MFIHSQTMLLNILSNKYYSLVPHDSNNHSILVAKLDHNSKDFALSTKSYQENVIQLKIDSLSSINQSHVHHRQSFHI
jgi:hypothetical protein